MLGKEEVNAIGSFPYSLTSSAIILEDFPLEQDKIQTNLKKNILHQPKAEKSYAQVSK